MPRLAESVTPNADGTVWTIKLRPSVTFHDGTPMDAAAVKANIDARKAVPITGDSIKQIDEVIVVDTLTAEVQMSTPWFGYDYTLAAQAGYMVAPSLIGQPDAMQKAIGTGPFELDGSWSPGYTGEGQALRRVLGRTATSRRHHVRGAARPDQPHRIARIG